MRLRDLIGRLMSGRLLTREVRTFLAVGGTGYIVDVAAFNLLRSLQPFSALDPSVARTVAVALAMCVTYLGNRTLTWRDRSSGDRRREVGLFVLFNIVGFGFSVVTLILSHDALGLTSRTADNISANVVGLALGTVFRYLTYKRFVFAPAGPGTLSNRGLAGGQASNHAADYQHEAACSSNDQSDSETPKIQAA
jgi:putative flippase GtrA